MSDSEKDFAEQPDKQLNEPSDKPSELSEAIGDMLGKSGSQEGGPISQRRHARYDTKDLILYISQCYEPGKIPAQWHFFPVRCRNLSCGGLSFFFPTRPSFQSLVVQLGDPEKGNIYMEAKVAHIDPISEIPEPCSVVDTEGHRHEIRFGTQAFTVGCQFLQRIMPG